MRYLMLLGHAWSQSDAIGRRTLDLAHGLPGLGWKLMHSART